MKKIVPALVVLVLVAVALTSCKEPVTPAAYVRFDTGDSSQVVVYSTSMYLDQVKVYVSQEALDTDSGSPALIFDFPRILGPDELEGKRYTVVDLSESKQYLNFYIYKGSGLYDDSKKLYLNGVAMVPGLIQENDSMWVFSYVNVPYKRTNENGKIDPNAVNVLEYK